MLILNNTLKQFYRHILIFVTIIFIGNSLINFVAQQEKNRYLAMQTEILKTKYETNYKYFKIMSHDIYTIYEDNKNLIKLIQKANDATPKDRDLLREKLYKKTIKRYKRLKNMGILQLHFHLKDNTSFLRLHKPKKFGDNLTTVRPSVAKVNRTKVMVDGFEVGRIIHGFRFVYPLFSEKKHIGSMEVSFSSEKLMDTLLNNKMIDAHFLISKANIEEKIFSEYKNNLYSPSIESPKYLLETRTHHSIEDSYTIHKTLNAKLLKNISTKLDKGIAFSISYKYNEESNIGSFIPIKSIDGDKVIAYIAVYIESDYLDSLSMQKLYIKILFISIILLLFIFSIYITINNNKLRFMAHYDKLTSLPNRAYFYIELEHEFKRAKRSNTKFAVMFIDLDGFKQVNDTYGHSVGDTLLINVSKRLLSCVRDVDIIARLGGDEFTITLVDIQSENDALSVANKIIEKLGQDFIINKKIIHVGASIGISIYPDYAQDSEEIIKQADNAMYVAKVNGKKCAIIYDNNKY